MCRNYPLIHKPKPNRAMVPASLLALGLCMVLNGCDNQPFISDGKLTGINGWDVSATVDVEPNSGPNGTPISMTIVFSRGATDVASIEMEDYAGASCNLGRLWRNVASKTSDVRWESPRGFVLTGLNGIGRFIARNSDGTRIAIGDVRINSGCSIRGRGIIPDIMPPDGVGGVRFETPQPGE